MFYREPGDPKNTKAGKRLSELYKTFLVRKSEWEIDHFQTSYVYFHKKFAKTCNQRVHLGLFLGDVSPVEIYENILSERYRYTKQRQWHKPAKKWRKFTHRKQAYLILNFLYSNICMSQCMTCEDCPVVRRGLKLCQIHQT